MGGVGEAFVAFEEVLKALVALAVFGGEVFLALGSFVALADVAAEEIFSAFASTLCRCRREEYILHENEHIDIH